MWISTNLDNSEYHRTIMSTCKNLIIANEPDCQHSNKFTNQRLTRGSSKQSQTFLTKLSKVPNLKMTKNQKSYQSEPTSGTISNSNETMQRRCGDNKVGEKLHARNQLYKRTTQGPPTAFTGSEAKPAYAEVRSHHATISQRLHRGGVRVKETRQQRSKQGLKREDDVQRKIWRRKVAVAMSGGARARVCNGKEIRAYDFLRVCLNGVIRNFRNLEF
ncbi:hypothetical protein A2U01_0013765 [Trifolium medium]|uniref:Uncharacterized protein n=1 Tax=Trifolium medium TaxID=97028 RepID=A0A392MZR5_9FABA|nr:hypothetical protein [Trifolium medium]